MTGRNVRSHRKFLVIGILIFSGLIYLAAAWYQGRHAAPISRPFPRQKIVVGCTDNFPPFDLRDENGDHIGYARDISMAVAEELGVDIEYRTSPRWVEVVEWLKNGEVDLIHLIAYSRERDEYFDFTIPHTLVPEVIFVRSERLDIHGLDDLEGKQIGAVRRHITHEKLLKYEGLDIMVFETPREGVEALLDGKVDAFAYPQFVFEYLAQQMGREDEIKIVGDPLGHLRYGMAVREGDQVLLSYLDRAIQRIEASGKRDEIAQRWFGRKVFLGLTREEALSLIGWAVFGVLVASLGGSAYISVRYRLRKAEAVLRHNLIFQHMDDGVIVTNLEGRITDWNPGAERMFGYSREEVLGRTLAFLYAPEDSTELSDTIIRGVQRDGIWSGEIGVLQRNGSRAVCSTTVTALRNEKGEAIAAVSINRDITARKRAEEEIKRRSNELSVLHEAAIVGMSTLDFDEILRRTAHVVREMLGFETFGVLLIDEATSELHFRVAYGFEPRQLYAGDRLRVGWGITGWVAETGQPLLVPDVTQHDRRIPGVWEAGSEMCVPLKVGKRVIGVIDVESPQRNAFSKDDLRLLATLAGQLAVIIENARLYEEATHRVRELSTLYESSKAISQLLAVDAFTQRVIEVMEGLQDYEYGAILLIDEQTGELVPFALSDQGKEQEFVERDKEYVRSRGVKVGVGITGWVAQTGQAVRIGDVRQDPRYLAMRPDIRSELCVPLKIGERIIGVMNIETPKPDAYTEHDERLLMTLAGQVAVAIENMRLYQDVKRAAAELEQTVEARTAELAAANQELQAANTAMLNLLEDLNAAKSELEKRAHLLEEAMQRAQEADRLKTAFLATVSHELRTPLASIKGFATTLLADDVTWDADSQRDFLQTIDQEANRLTELISQLLDMSRLEAGTLRIERERCYLADILTRIEERLGVLTARHQLGLEVGPDLPALKVDPIRIGNVLTNLVENAAKFAPAGTKITVTARDEDGQIVVSVADEGPGIAPEHQVHLFERFYRVDNEITRSRPGTGLGLAICKRLVEAHGGRIWVESEPGQGATFFVSLPATSN